MGSFSEDSSEKNKLIIGIWAGVYLTTPSLLPPALNACYAGLLMVIPEKIHHSPLSTEEISAVQRGKVECTSGNSKMY
jgi:hypothetical protein